MKREIITNKARPKAIKTKEGEDKKYKDKKKRSAWKENIKPKKNGKKILPPPSHKKKEKVFAMHRTKLIIKWLLPSLCYG